MRQDFQNVLDIQGRLFRGRTLRRSLNCFAHAVFNARRLYCTWDFERSAPAVLVPENSPSAPIHSMKKKKIARQKTKPAPPAPKTSSVKPELADRLRYFEERRDAIVETTRQLVEVESPSDNKSAVDRLGSLLAGRFEKLGGHSKFHKVQDFGNHLQVDFPGRLAASRSCSSVTSIPCIQWERCRTCHAELRMAETRRARRTRHEVGHRDDAARHWALRDWHSDALPRPVTVLLVTDEEVGSDSSRRITENLARNAAAGWYWNPPRGKGRGENRAQGSGRIRARR